MKKLLALLFIFSFFLVGCNTGTIEPQFREVTVFVPVQNTTYIKQELTPSQIADKAIELKNANDRLVNAYKPKSVMP